MHAVNPEILRRNADTERTTERYARWNHYKENKRRSSKITRTKDIERGKSVNNIDAVRGVARRGRMLGSYVMNMDQQRLVCVLYVLYVYW